MRYPILGIRFSGLYESSLSQLPLKTASTKTPKPLGLVRLANYASFL
jgi:hypothetical protein